MVTETEVVAGRLNGRPGAKVYITAGQASAKYGTSNSILYTWRDQKKIHYKEGKGFLETDVAREATDPAFLKRSAARAKSFKTRGRAPAAQKLKRASIEKLTSKRRQVQRQVLAQTILETANVTTLAHHVAYVAGRTDEFIAAYAKAHQVDERELAHSLGQLLATR
jgi:hypothetical protein